MIPDNPVRFAQWAVARYARYHVEDAAQETLARVWERYGELSADGIEKLARDVAMQTRYAQEHPFSGAHPYTLAEHPVVALEINEALDAADDEGSDGGFSPRVEAALNKLSGPLRDAAVSVYAQGLTSTELAGMCGVTRGTITNRMAKAKKKLREELSA